MTWLLYSLVFILLCGGLILIFGRNWVWKIDSRSESHEKDADGNPIRTEQWDKMHRLQGVIMVAVAFILGIVIYFLT